MFFKFFFKHDYKESRNEAVELEYSRALSTFNAYNGLSVSGLLPANLWTVFLNQECEDSRDCSFSCKDLLVIWQYCFT